LATDPSSDPDALIGQVLDGKYRVDAPLGSGGMGTVYHATHVGTGRAVALKVLQPRLTAHEAAVERFRREARAAGQMRHPNVVDVTDFGFASRGSEQLAYLVMELLQGKTLRAVLEAEGKLPPDVAVDVLEQVCAGVSEAHRLGILHRDLKPENIHLQPDSQAGARRYRVKVLDFGIAKLMQSDTDSLAATPAPGPALATPSVGDPSTAPTQTGRFGEATTLPSGLASGDASLTRAGSAIGTPLYMSPEQWVGRAVDARSDVYSLGVVAYEMLGGAPPFLGKDHPIAYEHAEVAPPSLSARVPDLPRRIVAVVLAALAKDPHARPPSAAAFAAALQEGTETTGTLLRRSLALCLDHYGLFFARCTLLTVPSLGVAVLGAAASILAQWGLVSAGVSLAGQAVGGLGLVLVTALLYGPTSGLLVPLVADLVGSPALSHPPSHGSPRPRPSASQVWRTSWRTLPSSLVWFSLLILVSLAAGWLVHGQDAVMLVSIPFMTALTALVAVYPAVVVMEQARGLSPLRRSVRLLAPVWRAAFGVQLFYTVLTVALPELLRLSLGKYAPGGTGTGGPKLGVFWTFQVLAALSNLVLTPFTLVPMALLYLRARQAEGES
jgi:serine/threonine protein kinase